MAKDVEKVDYIEATHNKYANIGLTMEETEFYENYPEDGKRRMVRKIDFRLVPVLALLYLMVSIDNVVQSIATGSSLLTYDTFSTQAHIDRANIGNAKIEGMVEDLGMTGILYNIALSLFFIPYILLEGTICFLFILNQASG